MNIIKEYKAQRCPHCGQTETWLAKMSQGQEELLKAIATAIKRKGINVIHTAKEIVRKDGTKTKELNIAGYITPSQNSNLTTIRSHGLIAKIQNNSGAYCLTTKGAQFLKGQPIPKVAVVSKVEKKQIGYLIPDETDPKNWYIVGKDNNEGYWGGFEINEGKVIKTETEQRAMNF